MPYAYGLQCLQVAVKFQLQEIPIGGPKCVRNGIGLDDILRHRQVRPYFTLYRQPSLDRPDGLTATPGMVAHMASLLMQTSLKCIQLI
jgi:hypothetical protein